MTAGRRFDMAPPHMSSPQTFESIGGLARRAGVSRTVITRLLSQGAISPSAYVLFGEVQQPLFTPEIAVHVVRAVRPIRSLPRGIAGGVVTTEPLS